MFQVIDAECGGFFESDSAEMAGDLEPTFMSRLDGGGKFSRAQFGIGFKRSGSLIGPLVYISSDACRVLGHTRAASEVRRGQIGLRPRLLSRVYLLLDGQITFPIYGTGGADGGDAAGEIESWEAEPHVGEALTSVYSVE